MLDIHIWNPIFVKLFRKYKIDPKNHKLIFYLGTQLCPLKELDDVEEIERLAIEIIEKTISVVIDSVGKNT